MVGQQWETVGAPSATWAGDLASRPEADERDARRAGELLGAVQEREDGGEDHEDDDHGGDPPRVEDVLRAQVLGQAVLDGLGERSLLEDEAEDEHRGEHKVADSAEEVVLARDVPGWGAGRCRTGRVLVYSPGPRSRSRSRKPSVGRLGTGASAPYEPPWARTRQP